ncbi:thioredoxin reductase [Sinosporangium siamense]|uniref:Thioredoxin reductase n=2 Tax=Sinosporangium siamense TaxID=1367973 RepID=A0A919RKP1_9ACTN|nr:thioredoxin reductase [Sinosporangium siamense]
MQEQHYDVVVIGGGVAGLSGALALGRARRSVLVIDSGGPRNMHAENLHTYLGRDGTAPGEMLRIARDEVRRYGVMVREGTVVEVSRDKSFHVVLADTSVVHARRLLVTTGLTDELPDVPGIAQLWGKDVLYCPYCHGWEVRDETIGVLATDGRAVHQALHWRQWTTHITLFQHTGPEPTKEEHLQLAARGIPVVRGTVARLDTTGGRLSHLRLSDGGTAYPCRALVIAPWFRPRADFLAPLGVKPADFISGGQVIGRHIAADEAGATGARGVWVAGNVTSPLDQLIAAAAAGSRAAMAINTHLIAEETHRALNRPSPIGAGHSPSSIQKGALSLRRPWWTASGVVADHGRSGVSQGW